MKAGGREEEEGRRRKKRRRRRRDGDTKIKTPQVNVRSEQVFGLITRFQKTLCNCNAFFFIWRFVHGNPVHCNPIYTFGTATFCKRGTWLCYQVCALTSPGKLNSDPSLTQSFRGMNLVQEHFFDFFWGEVRDYACWHFEINKLPR